MYIHYIAAAAPVASSSPNRLFLLVQQLNIYNVFAFAYITLLLMVFLLSLVIHITKKQLNTFTIIITIPSKVPSQYSHNQRQKD